MKKDMELVSLYLPKALNRDDIENAFDVTLKKGIEATLYAEIGDAFIAYTHFNVMTLINVVAYQNHP